MTVGGSGQPVLYWVICSAPPALDWPHAFGLLRDAGWDVCVILTPTAAGGLNTSELEAATGHTVRSAARLRGEQDDLPPADAVLVAPATFNTINKWAAGISDTLALGLLNELLGLGRPIVTVPWPNVALARHPAFGRSISMLRDCGITVILDLEQLPDDDAPAQAEFPWDELRRELARMRAAFA